MAALAMLSPRRGRTILCRRSVRLSRVVRWTRLDDSAREDGWTRARDRRARGRWVGADVARDGRLMRVCVASPFERGARGESIKHRPRARMTRAAFRHLGFQRASRRWTREAGRRRERDAREHRRRDGRGRRRDVRRACIGRVVVASARNARSARCCRYDHSG